LGELGFLHAKFHCLVVEIFHFLIRLYFSDRGHSWWLRLEDFNGGDPFSFVIQALSTVLGDPVLHASLDALEILNLHLLIAGLLHDDDSLKSINFFILLLNFFGSIFCFFIDLRDYAIR